MPVSPDFGVTSDFRRAPENLLKFSYLFLLWRWEWQIPNFLAVGALTGDSLISENIKYEKANCLRLYFTWSRAWEKDSCFDNLCRSWFQKTLLQEQKHETENQNTVCEGTDFYCLWPNGSYPVGRSQVLLTSLIRDIKSSLAVINQFSFVIDWNVLLGISPEKVLKWRRARDDSKTPLAKGIRGGGRRWPLLHQVS